MSLCLRLASHAKRRRVRRPVVIRDAGAGPPSPRPEAVGVSSPARPRRPPRRPPRRVQSRVQSPSRRERPRRRRRRASPGAWRRPTRRRRRRRRRGAATSASRANALSAFRSAASAMRTGVVPASANTRRVTARLASEASETWRTSSSSSSSSSPYEYLVAATAASVAATCSRRRQRRGLLASVHQGERGERVRGVARARPDGSSCFVSRRRISRRETLERNPSPNGPPRTAPPRRNDARRNASPARPARRPRRSSRPPRTTHAPRARGHAPASRPSRASLPPRRPARAPGASGGPARDVPRFPRKTRARWRRRTRPTGGPHPRRLTSEARHRSAASRIRTRACLGSVEGTVVTVIIPGGRDARAVTPRACRSSSPASWLRRRT